MFHVSMLRKYTPDPAHVVDLGGIVVETNGTFEEGSVHIMDSWDQVLRHKIVLLVKVLFQHLGVEEATWECETRCKSPIISYLRMKVCLSIIGNLILKLE